MTYEKSGNGCRYDDDICGGGRRRRHHSRHRGRRGARKERVLHTRISEQLADDIRRFAEELRVPASNLVRNVLEEVFDVVEGVSDDVGDLFEDILEEAEATRDRMRRRSGRSRGRSRPAHGRESDEKVESELRDDERREAEDAQVRTDAQGPTDSSGSEPTSDVDEPESAAAPREFPDVIGWQPLVLNLERECASCRVRLPRGSRAYVGLGESGLTPTTLCRACVGR